MKTLRKIIYSLFLLGAIFVGGLTTHVVSADTIPTLQAWIIGTGNVISPRVASSSVKIPSLASSGLCLSTNPLGTLSTTTCGSGGGNGDVNWGGNTNGVKKLIGSNDNFDIGFKTNNLERLTILNNGNVGINTTNPSVALDVNGDILAGNLSGNNTGDQDLTGLVPYTGATGSIYLGTNGIYFGTASNDFFVGNAGPGMIQFADPNLAKVATFDISAITPSTNVTYAFPNASGNIALTSDLSGFLTDAPSDGNTYGRNNANWVTVSGGGGSATTTINNVAGPNFNFNTGTSGTDFNIATSTGTLTFNIPDASISARGLISTTTQTFIGGKTFVQPPVFTKATDATAKIAFDVSNISSGQTRTLTIPDRSLILDNITASSTTSLSGILKGNGSNVATATLGVDYSNAVSNLTDTTIATATVDQALVFNGSKWVNKSLSVSSASQGIDFFMDDTSIIGIGTNNTTQVNTLSKTPITTTETVDTVAVTAGTSPATGEAYLYNTALGRTVLDGGVWSFDTYASVSSTAGGRVSNIRRSVFEVAIGSGTVTTTGTLTTRTATITGGTPFVLADVGTDSSNSSYLQTPQGLYKITAFTSSSVVTIEVPTTYANESGAAYNKWKYLFQSNSPTITTTGTNYSLYTSDDAEPAFTISTTSKLGEIVFGVSNNTTSVSWTHNGMSRYSFFKTPLITLHNNLAGLQGGAAGEYYHITAAQATVVGNTSGINTGNETTSSVGALIHSSTATTTPFGGDLFGIWGTVTNSLQSISWANLKAALKSYFDTIYQAAGTYLTSVTVDSPLTGAGTSASHLSIPMASSSASGYLSNTDWSTFNGKQAAGSYLTSASTLDASKLSGAIPTGVLGNSSLYIGTTAIALNRASAALALTGITSIDGNAATVTTNANLTGPITSVGNATAVNLTAFSNLNGPQGFGTNYQIVTSVASNNLTVALKGMDGNDPSPTNPIYIRIGNTVRAVTSATSYTENAGFNWRNSGSAELAAKEMDIFVYLSFRSTNSTVYIGWSRIPYARTISDFSQTYNNEKAASDTFSGQTSTDQVELIGRFNATLSASPNYYWSIPATSIIINRPIYETRWLTWTPAYTGFSSAPTGISYYKINQNTLSVNVVMGAGTSNGTGLTMSLPLSSNGNGIGEFVGRTQDNSSENGPGVAYITANSNSLVCFKTNEASSWTASGTKIWQGQLSNIGI